MTKLTLDRVIRVSRRNGRKGDSFLSPGEQRDAIDRYTSAHGIRQGEEHDETDSVSGGDVLHRDGLGTAVRRALAGETDGIVVAKLDRYARNLLEGLQVIETLEAAGKQVHSAAEGVCAGPGMSPQARMLRNVMLSVAQMERERQADGLDGARESAIARGIHGQAPFGYVKGEDRRLEPYKPEARWVRHIFEGRAAGRSWTALADELNDRGIRPRRAQRWTHTRIKNVVERRTYLGEAASGEYVNPEAHPPLVSVALWEAANGQRQTAPRRNRESFLLAGLLRCASCGVRMKGTATRKHLKAGVAIYRTYCCRRFHGFGTCPAPARVSAEKVEAIVEAAFRDLYLTERPYVGRQVVSTELAEAKAALATARKEMNAFVVAAKALEADAFQAGMDVRQADVAAARRRVEAAQLAETGVRLPEDLAEQWPTLEIADRRGFLSDGLAVVAVAPGRGPGLAERVAVWAASDPAAPRGLPGHGNPGPGAITPIDMPEGPGVAAG